MGTCWRQVVYKYTAKFFNIVNLIVRYLLRIKHLVILKKLSSNQRIKCRQNQEKYLPFGFDCKCKKKNDNIYYYYYYLTDTTGNSIFNKIGMLFEENKYLSEICKQWSHLISRKQLGFDSNP